MITQLKQKDLKEWRKQQLDCQFGRCAITCLPLAFEETVVEHCHKTKAEETGVDGKGLIRGVVHFGVNALEGKITNAYKRYGLKNLIPLPDLLRCIANYLENPIVKDIAHPSCIKKIKKKKLNKTDVKRVLKYWAIMFPKRRIPKPPIYENKEWLEYIRQSKEIRDMEKMYGLREKIN